MSAVAISGQFVTAAEALNPKVKHTRGHKRLGLEFTTCGKAIGSRKALGFMKQCEQCAAQAAEDNYKLREDDLLRKNYIAMRDAKIRAEEALLQKETEIIHLKEENLALAQTNERALNELRRTNEKLSATAFELVEARISPFRFWLRTRFFKDAK